ncbi:MAG: hypothetical protein LBL50_00950 [Candidatus Margulisbacteria bacterium]|nr:hypothetical protein [Candidatus Margulisiibacteriota bacterium]
MADNYTDASDTNFKGIVGGVTYNIETGEPLSAEGVRNALHTKENVANKKDTLNDSSTEYPSSKAVYALAQELAAAALPVGMILAMSVSSWINASTAFKSNWKVCDGTGGTPDLRGRFLRGGTASDPPTGDGKKILSINEMPSHSHGVKDNGHKHSGTSIRINATWDWLTTNVLVDTTREPTTRANVSTEKANISIENNGSGQAFDVVPAFYTVIYIMKIS